MPRVSLSTDYLLHSPWCASDYVAHGSARYHPTASAIAEVPSDEQRSVLSPTEIDEILSRKLYSQLKATAGSVRTAQEQPSKEKIQTWTCPSTFGIMDPELIMLIDRFFNLTYLNTIPMVNLLATAVATNFLKENIRALDKTLQQEQAPQASRDLKRGTSLLYEVETDTDDDDNLSWASAPT